jgi:EAL domain-containing protein (putative c-di-GMP-specific phosphodiesterase class I)
LAASGDWYLEESIDDGDLRRVEINVFPFRIGRVPDLELRIRSASVSRLHAELTQVGDKLLVRDLGSSNGTFVNRQRVDGVAPLRMGDVLHVGSVELRLRREESGVDELGITQLLEGELSSRLPNGTREFYELLSTGAVAASLQPIVEAGSRACHGYELLGRGVHAGLPADPTGLFDLAESLGMAADLSELFRRQGLEAISEGFGATRVFINTHPHELLAEERLFSELRRLRGVYPDAHLVLEIHERAVVDSEAMVRIGHLLADLDMPLAYDDFGAGQARLKELVRFPPDYLKFDSSMVLGLAEASEARGSLIALLLGLTRDLGILTIAEGIESEADALACVDAGFDLLQGFHVGRPGPLAG